MLTEEEIKAKILHVFNNLPTHAPELLNERVWVLRDDKGGHTLTDPEPMTEVPISFTLVGNLASFIGLIGIVSSDYVLYYYDPVLERFWSDSFFDTPVKTYQYINHLEMADHD